MAPSRKSFILPQGRKPEKGEKGVCPWSETEHRRSGEAVGHFVGSHREHDAPSQESMNGGEVQEIFISGKVFREELQHVGLRVELGKEMGVRVRLPLDGQEKTHPGRHQGHAF